MIIWDAMAGKASKKITLPHMPIAVDWSCVDSHVIAVAMKEGTAGASTRQCAFVSVYACAHVVVHI